LQGGGNEKDEMTAGNENELCGEGRMRKDSAGRAEWEWKGRMRKDSAGRKE
jgi:hypothetical protein